MKQLIDWLSAPSGFMPHGHCYLWAPGLVWLHVISDGLIVLAYYSIPLSLGWFVSRRKDVDFRWMYVCFAVFILACGTTHLLEIWNVWHADYWLSGGMKALTAAASLPTAYLLTKLLPVALALPSPGSLQLANANLAAEVKTRRQTEEKLRELTVQLESRVEERTAALRTAIAELQRKIEDHNRAREELRESDELFSKAFRLSPDCVVIIRQDDRTVIRANEALAALWGSTPAEIIGKPTRDYTSWLSEDERRAFMARLEETGECLDREAVLRLSDGREVPFSISSRLITFNGARCILSVMRDITERRRAENALRELSAIVEFSDDAIIGKTLQSTVTSWNRGAERIFGYTAEEMIGNSIMRLIPPDRQSEEASIVAQIAQGAGVRHFETVRQRKGGGLVDISVTVSPIKDSNGRVIGASKIARDISEQKRASQALRMSEEKFVRLFDSSPAATSLSSIEDGRYLAVNRAFLAMFQWPKDEVVGRTVFELNTWVDLEQRAALLAAFREHGAVENFEMQLRAKSGQIIDLLWSGVLVSIDGTSCMLGSGLDITERKKAEEAVRRLNADLEQRVIDRTAELADLYNNAPCGYHSLDGEGRVVGVNETELRWLGYDRVEVVGKMHATELLTPASREVFQTNFPKLKAVGRLENLELEMVRRDGSILPVLLSATMVTDEHGGNLRTRSTIIDYTDRRRADLALRASQKQLEMANQELEAFSYSVSHDLRAPLRAVNGFARIMIEDYGPQLPPEGQRFLQNIGAGAQQMGVLIDDLLTFSRLSRLPLSRRPVGVGKLVQECLGDLATQSAGRPVELRIGDLPDCSGDPALLKQMWVNLLSNALKYTRGRKPAVIEVGCEPRDGRNVYFVRDNGAGFDMRYADKLFGVFQRLHRAEDFEGTGVGLAIVQRVVLRHGGRVWAEAAVDRGATFYFNLGENQS